MKTILLIILLYTPLFFFAQETGLKNEKEIKKTCDEVMQNILKKDYETAFTKLMSVATVPKEEMEKFKAQSIEQKGMVAEKFGEYLDYKLVKESEIGGIVKQLTYVIRLEKSGLKYVFYFYNGKDNLWRLTNFAWNDELTPLLDD